MMTLYSRKLLPAEEPGNNKPESCYMCYVCPDDCYLQPPPPSPPPPPSQPQSAAAVQKHHIPSILIVMLCVLGVAFLVLSYLTIRRYRNCRRRNPSSSMAENRINSMRDDYFVGEDRGPDTAAVDHHIWYIRTSGLSQSLIDSIAVFEYQKGEGIIEGVDCSVCLSEFQENEKLRLLPKCSHAFHLACIDTWLNSHKNCPVCRAPVSIVTSNNNINNNSNTNRNSNNVQLLDSIETNVTSSIEENRDESEEREERIENNQEGNIVLDDEMVSRIEKFRVVSDLVDHGAKFDQELEPVRRSLSLDFSCASMIYDDVITKRDGGFSEITYKSDLIIGKRDCKGSIIKSTSFCSTSSCGISVPKGHASMKRSFSFSGKRSLRKNNISPESIPIRELTIYTKSQSINL